MRLSRPDDSDATKRRHFEISIDSPFNILSCRATQANISLPAYSSGGATLSSTHEFECGCPGAILTRRNTPPVLPAMSGSPTQDSPVVAPTPQRSWSSDTGGLTLPSQAHVHNGDSHSGATSRPIHLLRAPSFNPPAFNDDDPPPPLITPPPLYENAIDGNSQNALADYFARLAAEEGDDDDRHDRGRMDHPLTPGGRVHRSMDIPRNWAPLGGTNNLTSPTGQQTSTAI